MAPNLFDSRKYQSPRRSDVIWHYKHCLYHTRNVRPILFYIGVCRVNIKRLALRSYVWFTNIKVQYLRVEVYHGFHFLCWLLRKLIDLECGYFERLYVNTGYGWFFVFSLSSNCKVLNGVSRFVSLWCVHAQVCHLISFSDWPLLNWSRPGNTYIFYQTMP